MEMKTSQPLMKMRKSIPLKAIKTLPKKAMSMPAPKMPNRSVERMEKGMAKSGIKALGKMAALKALKKSK